MARRDKLKGLPRPGLVIGSGLTDIANYYGYYKWVVFPLYPFRLNWSAKFQIYMLISNRTYRVWTWRLLAEICWWMWSVEHAEKREGQKRNTKSRAIWSRNTIWKHSIWEYIWDEYESANNKYCSIVTRVVELRYLTL